MASKFSHRLDCIFSLRNHKHIRLRTNDHAQPFTKDRMVFNAEDTNRFYGNHSQTASFFLDSIGLSDSPHKVKPSSHWITLFANTIFRSDDKFEQYQKLLARSRDAGYPSSINSTDVFLDVNFIVTLQT